MKKNILVLTPIFYPHVGGAEKSIHELYKGLSKHYNVDILTPNFGGIEKEDNGYYSIYRVCNISNNRFIKFFKYQYYQFKTAYQLQKKKEYSLIHTHYIFPSSIVALLIKYLYKIPLITTEHHFGTGMDITSKDENPTFVNFLMSIYVKKANLLVSTGNTQDNFLKYLNNNMNFKTIELGGDCIVSNLTKSQIKKDLNIPREKKIFFSISRIVKRKRYDLLLESLHILKKYNSNFVCYIAGSGDQLESLRKMSLKLNLEKEVFFLGYTDDLVVEKYRKIADCFLSASEFEGAGIMYYEALASKIPIFVKKNASTVSIVTHKKNGFIYETAEELALLLEKYAWNSKKLKRISSQGFGDYEKKYNWKKHCEEYLRVYEEILK